jgi:hypothetical protein
MRAAAKPSPRGYLFQVKLRLDRSVRLRFISRRREDEFIAAPKDQIGTVLTWLEGYYTKDNAPPIMYADKTIKDAKNLSDYCNAHPDNDIIQAAETVMPVK